MNQNPNDDAATVSKCVSKLSISKKDENRPISFSFDSTGARLGMRTAIRPDRGGTKGTSTQFKVNFFKIDIDFSTTAYQYNLEIKCEFARKDGSKGSFVAKKEHKW